MEDMVSLRASFLIDRALTGLRIDFDKALELLRERNNFTTQREHEQRNIVLAAVDNLIDFAAAQQWTMISELAEQADMEIYESTCRLYNYTYAEAENGQVQHSAAIAAWWIGTSAQTIITFMTQSDERVRPWHLSHEGESYLKSQFPPELIPPIEWGCRCYLVADGFGSVYGAIRENGGKHSVNPIFAESLATAGRIFTHAHPYFRQQLPEPMQEIVTRIKKNISVL